MALEVVAESKHAMLYTESHYVKILYRSDFDGMYIVWRESKEERGTIYRLILGQEHIHQLRQSHQRCAGSQELR